LLTCNQALIERVGGANNGGMESDASQLAAILAADLSKGSGIDRAALAQECGISNQAISNWIKTGRIKKRYLPVVAKHTGKPLSRYLLDSAQPYPLNPPSQHAAQQDPAPHYESQSREGRARQRTLKAIEELDIEELELLAEDIERDAARHRRLRLRRTDRPTIKA